MLSQSTRLALPLIQRTVIRQPLLRRQVHQELTDAHHRALPFSTTSRRALAVKTLAYLGFGFSIPFVATWWQWNRPGGIHNPIV